MDNDIDEKFENIESSLQNEASVDDNVVTTDDLLSIDWKDFVNNSSPSQKKELAKFANFVIKQLDPKKNAKFFEFPINKDLSIKFPKIKLTGSKKVNFSNLFNRPDSYLDYDLEPGLHVVFGGPGSGKSLFTTQIAKSHKIPKYVLFEHVLDVEDEKVMISIDEFNLFLSKNKDQVMIIDSLRIINLLATNYPAIMRGVSSVNFTFAQWLSLVAAKTNRIIIAVISTETNTKGIPELYMDYLKGGPRSVYYMTSLGEGKCMIKSKERGEFIDFELLDRGKWFSSGHKSLINEHSVPFNATMRVEENLV